MLKAPPCISNAPPAGQTLDPWNYKQCSKKPGNAFTVDKQCSHKCPFISNARPIFAKICESDIAYLLWKGVGAMAPETIPIMPKPPYPTAREHRDAPCPPYTYQEVVVSLNAR